MSLQELKNQADQLSVSDLLELVSALIESLRHELHPPRPRKGAAERLMGLAKTDRTPPTDTEVEAMLEERLVEKYLK
ncbi:hypothetical protein [Coleofasciculus sp. FACHB-1120]|uniref:hypothetical protein n=1 Tax=Coleofasciculus sp. FACHB-1120 TaxID=2692783 RepID=UPI0016873FCC|nr:hypothetical protein [Coleofasciculus sp. FACHB-1120]MBD2741206.1 hypothetical protein [Coleofasciculus sp. FACHB-1120]